MIWLYSYYIQTYHCIAFVGRYAHRGTGVRGWHSIYVSLTKGTSKLVIYASDLICLESRFRVFNLPCRVYAIISGSMSADFEKQPAPRGDFIAKSMLQLPPACLNTNPGA